MPTLKLVPVSVWLLASHSVTVNLLLSLKNQKEPLRALGRSCCMALGISSLCYMEVLRGEAWRGNCPDPFECPRQKAPDHTPRALPCVPSSPAPHTQCRGARSPQTGP